MIYHLVKAEKFIDTFIDSIDAFSEDASQNVYINRSASTEYTMRNAHRLLDAPYGSAKLSNIIRQFTESDQLIIHFMDLASAQWLRKHTIRASVRWVFWGAEFFKLAPTLDPGFKLLDPVSKKLYDDSKYEGLLKDNIFYSFAYNKYLRFRLNRLLNAFSGAVPKVDAIYHFNPFDTDYVNKCLRTQIPHVPFSYSNLYGYLKEHPIADASRFTDPTQTHVLLGNSATLSNNHLDVFARIEPREDLHIWCPLSYGKMRYGEYIQRQGKKQFGENFHAIIEYMPYDSYFELLAKMDYAIMAQNRSQAAGNVLIMLLLGKVVKMKSNTGLFQYFENMGATVKDLGTGTLQFPKLNNASFEANRRINEPMIDNVFGGENIKRIYRNLF